MPFVTSYERLSREEGLRLGRHEGLQQGLQQGLQEGLQTGETKALQENILELLEVRFSQVPEAIQQAVKTETDRARLRSWHRRAATAPDLDTFVRELEGR